MDNDNGFSKACPSGNHMIDAEVKEVKNPNDSPEFDAPDDEERGE